ncbi:MAG: NAD(P)/FAD-dependent oxidoreductase [Clostridiales bacterium]|nr:NAD(P)/FAD-dependent oxidoreductase [Clostridiales bacterium]
MHKVLVIGGGAAGMMAAIFASRTGAAVTVLERNEKLGKKVYITGKGRCNVTNDCTLDEFLREVPRNPRFLYSALSYFGPQQMMTLLEDGGCPVVVQRGRRVFPATEKASDVTRTLEKIMRENGVRIVYGARVAEILTRDGAVCGVALQDGRVLEGDRVILATGGLSCPLTGSTGDGYRMAETLGHTVTPRSAVLSAVETVERWPGELMGLSLRNVTLTLKRGKKTLYADMGEMLFTHFGISGPLVLTMSCHLPEQLSDAQVSLNLKPGLTREQLDARLQRDFDEHSRKLLRSVLPGLLPARLAEMFPERCGVDGDKICAQITREERERIAGTMQALPLTIRALAPIEEAIVTRGGVSVKEIDPSTMESKRVSGLYFAGEVIDVDAHTGGYNLQIAWATGALAGTCAAEEGFTEE